MLTELTALAAGALALAQAAQEPARGWACASQKTTGFSNASGEWISVDFAVQAKYVILPGRVAGTAWEVRSGSRSDLVEAACPEDFSRLEVLHCRGTMTELKFNRATGRFLRAYLAGYWSYTPNAPFFSKDGGDTPLLEIGTCSKL
jgi:hypothetical protein